MGTPPKAFISYSWTNERHAAWVLGLASQLRENGVDAILDKWDLREGNDAVAFMERMVTDPDIAKVILVLDKEYAEKADLRRGGVGTETQIITAEIYEKAGQSKFVAVIAERTDRGDPYRPTFYRNRIYIDLSSDEIYATNFDQLLRWIFEKPLHVKPKIGGSPAFLDEQVSLLATATRARRAIEQARSGAASASGTLSEYLATLSTEMSELRLTRGDKEDFDDEVFKSIDSFVPYRDEFLSVVRVTLDYSLEADVLRHIHRFFESVIPLLFRPPSAKQWSDDMADNLAFIIHELYLHTMSILLKADKLDAANWMLSQRYYVESAPAGNAMEDFTVFRPYIRSFETRNRRLFEGRRLSLHADLLKERAEASRTNFSDLAQADYVMYLRKELGAESGRSDWFPYTVLYVDSYRPFEIFARSESQGYFERVQPLIGGAGTTELRKHAEDYRQGRARFFSNGFIRFSLW